MGTQMIVKIFRHELYRPHAPTGTISSSYTFQLSIGITIYIDPLIRLFAKLKNVAIVSHGTPTSLRRAPCYPNASSKIIIIGGKVISTCSPLIHIVSTIIGSVL